MQPLTLDDQPRGTALLAVDALGAGVHEKVLIVMEGRAAGEALGRKLAPVDAAVVGIIDTVDVVRMTEQELRALVRDAIARHVRQRGRDRAPPACRRRSFTSTRATACSRCPRAPTPTALPHRAGGDVQSLRLLQVYGH